MVLSVLPAFFISVLKTGAGALGVVEGVADAAANLLKVYSGQRSDKMARRKIFAVLGYTLSVCTRPFYVFAGSVMDVASLRVIDRVGKGLRDSPRDALISLSVNKKEIGWSFGYHRAMDTLGGMLGPLIAYLILASFPGAFSSVFMVSFVVGLLAIGSLLWVKDVSALVSRGGFKPARSHLPKRLRRYIFSLFVLSAGTLPVAILLFKTQDAGFPIETIPLFYMIYNLSFSLVSWPAGRLVDMIGAGRVIVFGYLSLLVGYTALSLTGGISALVAGFLAVGFFSACTDGAQRSYITKLVGDEHRGAAYGYLHAAVGFGALIAGVCGGYVWEEFGAASAMFLGLLVVLIGLVALMSTIRGHYLSTR